MAKKRRPFNPESLRRHGVPAVRAQLGPETLVRRYTVVVPIEQIRLGRESVLLATAEDLQALQLMLIDHFGG